MAQVEFYPAHSIWLPSRPTIAILSALCFAGASRILPLYSLNQHTKFLHGLAWAYPDRLGADWTAATVDGLPVFTWLVYFVARFLAPSGFVVMEYALLAVCGWALYQIASGMAPGASMRPAANVALAALVALLSVAPERHVMTGVASQYLIGNYLQPSEFGVLFLLSMALVGAHPRAALLLAAAPAVMHPAYIPIAALMVAVQGWVLWRHRRGGDMFALAGALALIVAPQLDLALRFAPETADLQAEAMRIIAFERIPHHSLPRMWFGPVAFGKLALALVAIRLAPAGVLRSTLVVLVAFSTLGALFVAVSDNAAVALLAPWRASVVAMPLALTVLLGRGVPALFRGLERWHRAQYVAPGLAGALALAACGAVINSAISTPARHARTSSDPVAVVARQTPASGLTYLTVPSDFGFRLAAMAPQFISNKSHPYRASEVIEWRRRTELASAVFGTDERGAESGFNCDALRTLLRAYTVTHVVLPPTAVSSAERCPWLAPVPDAPPLLRAVVRERHH
jgi:hypothetical protein